MKGPKELDPRARWMRIDGDRRLALATLATAPTAPTAASHATDEAPAFAFGFEPEAARDGGDVDATRVTWLGPAPLLVRPLRPRALGAALAGAAPRVGGPLATLAALAPRVPLVTPFARASRPGVRALSAHDPRLTRLWERFSVDVGVAVERSAAYLSARAFDRSGPPHRMLVLEDGDRYAIRAMCMFSSDADMLEHDGVRVGVVHELLHDRSVTGMRAASHLLGLAVREMSDEGADALAAWSFVHSGSFPMFVRHGFLPWPGVAASLLPPAARGLTFGVRAEDPDLRALLDRRESWYVSWLDAEPYEARLSG
jgi:hypothetical protein